MALLIGGCAHLKACGKRLSMIILPMKKDKPLTMKDIASHFGVSVATVSRALKGHPRISEERRKAIVGYAREHDFVPNSIAESLRHNSITKVIGVIVPQLNHFYFSSILSGIEQYSSSHGYCILVAQSNEQYVNEVEICKRFIDNKVCGVIVSQAKDTARYDHFQKLMSKGVPLVFYDRICTGVNCSRVVVDDYMGAFMAVEHLVDTGCRRIAFFGTMGQLEISKNRYNGYRDALLKHGIKPDDSLARHCDNRTCAEAIAPDMLKGYGRPDAFFAINDDTAIGLLYTAKRMGLRVPEDVSICGFTNGERAVACDPMLTTVEQRGSRVGELAAQVLIDKVEGRIPVDSVEKKVVRTRLVLRGTTR